MIKYVTGNILKSDAEAIINTVNCVGIMGKGIALQFKKAFPQNFTAYEKACRHKEVRTGKMFIFDRESFINPKYIINFPTKRHWKAMSKYEDIDTGLIALAEDIQKLNIKSVAIPPLGCGLGGLAWNIVKEKIVNTFSIIPGIEVYLYEPKGAPAIKDMPIGTTKPKLTIARALLIELMHRYSQFAYRLTLLEIQKIAYFLQETGEPLRLNYVKHFYGPYAHNLNKVLELLEGHYTQGYGDTQKPDVEINLLPEAYQDAQEFLVKHPETNQRLEKVTKIIDGFETPYGMELLASVHWVIYHDNINSEAVAVKKSLKQWNNRKSKLFQDQHIQTAYKRLEECKKLFL